MDMPTYIFVVTVFHSSDHGNVSSLCVVTTHLLHATNVLRHLKELGYIQWFSSTDHGVLIQRLEINRYYEKESLQTHDHLPIPGSYSQVIFFRWSKNGWLTPEYNKETIRQMGLMTQIRPEMLEPFLP
ncbi:MAG: hypothetical protein UU08_C0023G0006 [Candidatus Uhrbacteria bacterium GW2011_GWE2_40_58]|nr:MAG: hypothetical protein UT94_C0020G0005 [Candidatus Uhrbacteria bacterium GW2011_GWF2_40_263]KKR67216.1 MAG: hypothetical protein UU08_C0023G0006 [Candidatus Uhrbacteria bacterium GW2011_GWE2_40_58]OGL93891.1 MAG: hypothetical protein A2239_00190 [Candidatus Uhrbacteria bacterium RIFOXYA2_FULL_40_9]OGL98082.1 MAG: hypothetical protein A2332_03040 [Candidatus Uhrbacteria bacterium RIFOXYB2_FULL_41_18]HBK34881.1 hypothetical protein [Candidatus Uhrbacteria bacterium]